MHIFKYVLTIDLLIYVVCNILILNNMDVALVGKQQGFRDYCY